MYNPTYVAFYTAAVTLFVTWNTQLIDVLKTGKYAAMEREVWPARLSGTGTNVVVEVCLVLASFFIGYPLVAIRRTAGSFVRSDLCSFRQRFRCQQALAQQACAECNMGLGRLLQSRLSCVQLAVNNRRQLMPQIVSSQEWRFHAHLHYY